MAGRVAVVLFQLGGPDSGEAVEPFLRNLFLDPDIIDFPGARIARGPLARLIASRRSRKVRALYEKIGGKSPINELTSAQARSLEESLRKTVDARVFIAMRYWKPFTDEAVAQIAAGGFDRIVLLPLYPHFSRATTLSSFHEWTRRAAPVSAVAAGPVSATPPAAVCCWHDHPLYIKALRDRIAGSLPSGDVHILFSAHGVPESLIRSGDPYRMQVETTVRLVMEAGAWNNPHSLCWQSRVGPGKWLQPSLHDELHRLATAGTRSLFVVPISFVTDHIETLYEIDIESREEAAALGIDRFAMMPALNSDPTFIACLDDLVRRTLDAGATADGTCRTLSPGGGHRLCPLWDAVSAGGTGPARSAVSGWK